MNRNRSNGYLVGELQCKVLEIFMVFMCIIISLSSC